MVTFPINTANTFKRIIPEEMSEPPRHNNVLKDDIERLQMLVQLGKIVSPDVKRVLNSTQHGDIDDIDE